MFTSAGEIKLNLFQTYTIFDKAITCAQKKETSKRKLTIKPRNRKKIYIFFGILTEEKNKIGFFQYHLFGIGKIQLRKKKMLYPL